MPRVNQIDYVNATADDTRTVDDSMVVHVKIVLVYMNENEKKNKQFRGYGVKLKNNTHAHTNRMLYGHGGP